MIKAMLAQHQNARVGLVLTFVEPCNFLLRVGLVLTFVDPCDFQWPIGLVVITGLTQTLVVLTDPRDGRD